MSDHSFLEWKGQNQQDDFGGTGKPLSLIISIQSFVVSFKSKRGYSNT
jgi:hypothetical protein